MYANTASASCICPVQLGSFAVIVCKMLLHTAECWCVSAWMACNYSKYGTADTYVCNDDCRRLARSSRRHIHRILPHIHMRICHTIYDFPFNIRIAFTRWHMTSPLTFWPRNWMKLYMYVTWTNFVSILGFTELFVLALLSEINGTDRQIGCNSVQGRN